MMSECCQLLLATAVLLCAALFQVHASVETDVLVDSRIPVKCSSPGWQESPYDIATLVGSYVNFNCRSSISHSQISWLYNGRTDIMASNVSTKAMIYNGKTSLRYGPIGYDDEGVAIGCEITTPQYGTLPSSLGTISVQTLPSYSPPLVQVAIIGQPFYLNLNYTSIHPPSRYMWLKNGRPIKSGSNRTTHDHTGIMFYRVEQEDAGQYTVVAKNEAGKTRAVSTLKVVYWFTDTHVQSGSKSTPTLSTKLAVTLALMHDKSSPHPSTYPPQGVSTSQVMRILALHFKKPSAGAALQGNYRLHVERLSRKVMELVGPDYSVLTDDDMERINNFTNCTDFRRKINCFSKDILKYRTIDGTCNNFFYPFNGAAMVPFARLIPASYEDGISLPVGHSQSDPFGQPWPSARLLSWKVVRNIAPPNSAGLTHMFMQWGQFLDHDLDIAPIFTNITCGCNYTEECFPISVKPEDGVYGVHGPHKGRCLEFIRSIPACQCDQGHTALARNQINDITSYIDASNIYGSSDEHAKMLRLFKGGLLKQGGRLKTLKGNLPFQEDRPDEGVIPFFVSGDERANEQTGLTIMHTLWLREHNRIARKLYEINPCWKDKRLYQEARKIVGGQMQAITFQEFLPHIFGSEYSTYVPMYRGYNPYIDATIPNSFATAAYRFGHSLVRNQLLRLDADYNDLSIGHLDLARAFFNPMTYFESFGTDPITRGLLVDQSNNVDEFVNKVLTTRLFTENPDSPESLGGDLASLNIQRGRDHGLPSYRTWQKFCEKLFPQHKAVFARKETVDQLRELYGEEGFNNGMDLWVGGLAERSLPGAQVGPTFACILGITFTRLRDGDRFWFDNPYTFTHGQRYEIKKHTSLSKVICTNADNIPELQKEAFRTGQQRVRCSSIPTINLWRWWDRRCYYQQYYGQYYGFW